MKMSRLVGIPLLMGYSGHKSILVCHILISVATRDLFASAVIANEDQLTPRKESFLKSMGKNRAGYQLL